MTTRQAARLLLAGLVVAVVIAVASAWLASGSPDGLERVAEDQQFTERAREPGFRLLPDYTIPGIHNERLSTALAGVAGVAIVGGIGLGAGWVLARRRRDERADG